MILDLNIYYRGGEACYPLYLYPDAGGDTEGGQRKPNIHPRVFDALKQAHGQAPSPEEVLHYVYAILYSNIYRGKYREFLRHDFPRVPFTADRELFLKMAGLGADLARLHLVEPSAVTPPDARFDGEGDAGIDKTRYDATGQRIFINKTQYFHPVPQEVWEYRVGGYQVLSKYLKDRKGKKLADPIHYISIITALLRTIKVQARIDDLYPDVETGTVDMDLSAGQGRLL